MEGQVDYDLPNPDQPELSAWLAANPHRFNLGRIGLKLLLSDGTEAGPGDIRNAVQETDLWKGIITSRFELDGIPVVVRTACHPDLDMIGVEVKSDLIRKGRLSVFINFPYADRNQGAAYVGVYDQPEKHHSSIKKQNRAVCPDLPGNGWYPLFGYPAMEVSGTVLSGRSRESPLFRT